MKLSNYDKVLYNTYLKVTRTHQNKKYKYRKNFDDFDEYQVRILKKISSIISKKNIDQDYYFKASYELYDDSDYYPLEYFSTFKAIKRYDMWVKHLYYNNPLHEVIQKQIKDGFMHIHKICKENNLSSAEEYFRLKCYSDYPLFLIDLNDRKICYFNIIGVDNFYSMTKYISEEVIDFLVKEFNNEASSIRRVIYSNNKLRDFIRRILTVINSNLTKYKKL